MAWVPNLLSPDTPQGTTDKENLEIRKWGELPDGKGQFFDHQELGEKLDIIDTKRGAKIAQSGYFYWKGKGAELASALFFWDPTTNSLNEVLLYFLPLVLLSKKLYLGQGTYLFLLIRPIS